MEELGYEGFAFGFHGDAVELVGTSCALKKIDAEDIEYFHAVVHAGEREYSIGVSLITEYDALSA